MLHLVCKNSCVEALICNDNWSMITTHLYQRNDDVDWRWIERVDRSKETMNFQIIFAQSFTRWNFSLTHIYTRYCGPLERMLSWFFSYHFSYFWAISLAVARRYSMDLSQLNYSDISQFNRLLVAYEFIMWWQQREKLFYVLTQFLWLSRISDWWESLVRTVGSPKCSDDLVFDEYFEI